MRYTEEASPSREESDHKGKESEMSILSFIKGTDINEELENIKIGMIIDIREPREYARGHIPGAINMPLGELETKISEIKDKNTPMYIYCLTGRRANEAVRHLKALGYTSVRNIGGIGSYKGELERTKGRSF